MKKILLTGADGFVGRNFVKLLNHKYDITQLQGDIRYVDTGELYYFNYECVVHLAALAGVRKSHEMPNEYWDVNVNGSKAIFNAARSVPVIYASSSSVYEWWLSPYATTKYVMETIAPFNSIGLRFHTVYGDNSRPDMLYDRLLKRDPTLSYLTNHTRDYTHVNDVVSAIDICMDNFFDLAYNSKSRVRVMDVGNGRPVSIIDVANKVWPGHNLPIKEVTGERAHTCANPGPLLELGWDPKHFILD